MHLISDPHRGYLLELLLTKILFHGCTQRSRRKSGQSKESGTQHIQIVGMSASLCSLPVLGSWLEAAVYTTDYRPIPLTELVYTKEGLYRVMTGKAGGHE